MIQIDPRSDVPVHVQVAKRIRYMIANGDFRTGDRLPATRKLADQLGISFHTVRRAYQDLASDGMVVAHSGSGFEVVDAAPLGKSDRMERGARIVSDALQQLVGLGLDDQEIEYLIEEQSALLETESEVTHVVVAATFQELSEACAEAVSSLLQRSCPAVLLSDLPRHADADFVLVPFRHIRTAMANQARADIVGIQYELDERALSAVARLLDSETLGLVTRYPDAIGPLTADLRTLTKFSGQVLAVSIQEGDTYLATLMRSCDLLLYTGTAGRRIRPFLERAKKHRPLGITLSASSVERIRNLIR